MAEAAEIPIKKEATSLSSREDFERYIDQEAPKYGLSPANVKSVVECESQWNPNAVGDNGTSFGLAQLHHPETKGMTVSQAKDPKIALDYLMSHWYKDRWTCQRYL